MNYDNLTESQILEAFDSKENKYPVVNLSPNDSVPQLFLIKAPGNDNLVLRLVSGRSIGESVKKLTVSDKVMHVYIMSLSASGNEVKLKGGLGNDPLGAISSIFDTVIATAKQIKAQAILFRFNQKQMSGKAAVVQRILSRLISVRSGGKYLPVDEIKEMGKKYAYVLAKVKNVPSDEIVGLPKPSEKEFKITDSSVGKVYIDDKTGTQVSKDYAISKAVADSADETTPQTILRKTKITRRTLLDVQFGDYYWYGDSSEDFEAMLDTPPAYDTKDIPESKLSLDISEQSGYIDTIGLKEQIYAKFKDPSISVNNLIMELDDLMIENLKSSQYTFGTLSKIISKNAKTTAQLLMAINKLFELGDIRNNIVAGKISVQDALKKAFLLTDDIEDKTTKDGIRNTIIRTFVNDPSQPLAVHIRDYSPQQYTNNEQTAIKSYTGEGYTKINNAFLSGDYDRVDKKIKNIINDLDTAFKKGERLPKDIILYRGQGISSELLNKAIENKIFYFGNFVSTSLKANIYTGEYGDFSQDYIDNHKNKPLKPLKDFGKSYIGWVISKAYRTKVIIPGNLAVHFHEVEVILPRGTALKMNAIAGSMNKGRYVIEAEVIEPSLLENTTEIYNGDLLMSEGKVEKLSYKYFKDNYNNALSESLAENQNQYILDQLVDYIDIESLPEKFKA